LASLSFTADPGQVRRMVAEAIGRLCAPADVLREGAVYIDAHWRARPPPP
jgi:hypothetical protein